MVQKSNNGAYETLHNQTNNDEINLVDLFLIVWKRKLMIIIVTLLLTVAAAGTSLIMQKIYDVNTILEPGRDAGGVLVVSPQTIRENILGGTYDRVIAEKLGLPLEMVPKFNVSIPKQTDLVKIAIESSEPQQAVLFIRELLNGITADIQEDLDLLVRETNNQIKQIKIKDGFVLEKIKLLTNQITQVDVKVTELEIERKKAIASPNGDAMAILLYSNEIKNQQIYLNDLQEKLANLTNQKSLIDLEIDNIQLKLDAIKGTIINKPPHVPVKPIKPKKALIVSLAFASGLIGGLMLALFAEFVARVRRQMLIVD